MNPSFLASRASSALYHLYAGNAKNTRRYHANGQTVRLARFATIRMSLLLCVFRHGLNKPDVQVDDSVRARPRADNHDLYARGEKECSGSEEPAGCVGAAAPGLAPGRAVVLCPGAFSSGSRAAMHAGFSDPNCLVKNAVTDAPIKKNAKPAPVLRFCAGFATII